MWMLNKHDETTRRWEEEPDTTDQWWNESRTTDRARCRNRQKRKKTGDQTHHRKKENKIKEERSRWEGSKPGSVSSCPHLIYNMFIRLIKQEEQEEQLAEKGDRGRKKVNSPNPAGRQSFSALNGPYLISQAVLYCNTVNPFCLCVGRLNLVLLAASSLSFLSPAWVQVLTVPSPWPSAFSLSCKFELPFLLFLLVLACQFFVLLCASHVSFIWVNLFRISSLCFDRSGGNHSLFFSLAIIGTEFHKAWSRINSFLHAGCREHWRSTNEYSSYPRHKQTLSWNRNSSEWRQTKSELLKSIR